VRNVASRPYIRFIVFLPYIIRARSDCFHRTTHLHGYRIDQALYKQSHKKEIEDQFQKKQQAVAEVSIPQGFDFDESDIMENISHIQQRRDRLLAKRNPQAYCADRCVATGNCDVFEDIFKFSPQEVMAFCEECVLSEDEEPCDVPDSFHDHFMSLKP
jgi:hypothetical protein